MRAFEIPVQAGDLFARLHLLGDVGRDARHAIDFAALVANRKRLIAHPAHRAIWVQNAELYDMVAARLPGQPGDDPRAVFRVYGFEKGHGMSTHALDAAAPDGLVAGTHVENLVTARIRHPEYFVDGLGDLAQQLLVLARRQVRSMARGDVAHLGQHELRAASGLEYRCQRDLDVAGFGHAVHLGLAARGSAVRDYRQGCAEAVGRRRRLPPSRCTQGLRYSRSQPATGARQCRGAQPQQDSRGIEHEHSLGSAIDESLAIRGSNKTVRGSLQIVLLLQQRTGRASESNPGIIGLPRQSRVTAAAI